MVSNKLSKLMKLSWQIQKRKRNLNRSKALQAAWAIVSNEDITVQYLALKLNHNKPVKWQVLNQMALFNK